MQGFGFESCSEDSTCHKATTARAMTAEPVYCNYGSLPALEPVLQKRSPSSEKPVQLQLEGNRCLLQLEKPLHSNKGLVWPKNKQINIQNNFQKDSLYFMLGHLF